MNQTPAYTEFHPQWRRARVSTYWWLERWSYLVFILRELSSVFIAWFVAFLLMLIYAVSQGDEPYKQFLAWAARPGVVLLNVVALFFVAFHALTWFNLAPKALVVRLRGKRVPAVWIAASNYAAWAVASALLAWAIFGG
jgi:fumarate reductase subunit C